MALQKKLIIPVILIGAAVAGALVYQSKRVHHHSADAIKAPAVALQGMPPDLALFETSYAEVFASNCSSAARASQP